MDKIKKISCKRKNTFHSY